mmetsp:Transcript_21832/g.42391  ORF Transcript_21832/g.42391 Transcript_21832/m.42391 type:complete len:294 (+) Transcript_21832:439-1320(+)
MVHVVVFHVVYDARQTPRPHPQHKRHHQPKSLHKVGCVRLDLVSTVSPEVDSDHPQLIRPLQCEGDGEDVDLPDGDAEDHACLQPMETVARERAGVVGLVVHVVHVAEHPACVKELVGPVEPRVVENVERKHPPQHLHQLHRVPRDVHQPAVVHAAVPPPVQPLAGEESEALDQEGQHAARGVPHRVLVLLRRLLHPRDPPHDGWNHVVQQHRRPVVYHEALPKGHPKGGESRMIPQPAPLCICGACTRHARGGGMRLVPDPCHVFFPRRTSPLLSAPKTCTRLSCTSSDHGA